jgi:hypothetical protein
MIRVVAELDSKRHQVCESLLQRACEGDRDVRRSKGGHDLESVGTQNSDLEDSEVGKAIELIRGEVLFILFGHGVVGGQAETTPVGITAEKPAGLADVDVGLGEMAAKK